MAILGTFEAQVIVNGVPAAEYDDDEEPVTNDPTLITKYVEAVSDALFAFKVKISPTYKFTNEDGLAVYAYIDGHSEGGRISRRQDLKTATAALVVDGHLQTENGRFKNCMFKFADLETRDLEKGDDTSMFREKYSELGTLRVEIWRARITGEAEPTRYEAKKNEVVPEKALKGRPLDVVTSYAPVDVPMENTVLVKLMDSKHLAKFIFKYRTRRALQSLMIIERSPTPLPLEERPVEELTREEMAELLRRQREQFRVKQEYAGLKRERAGTITDPRPLKSSKGENGETIYHLDSGSDDEEEEKAKPEVEVLDDDEDGGTTDPEIEIVDL